MEIKYNKHKQELRDDPVLDGLMKVKDVVTKNTNAILTGVVALLVVVAGGLIFNKVRNANESKVQEAFGKAMIAANENRVDKAVEQFKSIADNNGNSTQGVMSAYMLGSIMLSEKKYDQAIDYFKAAASKKSKVGFVGGQALEGIASCYDAKGDKKSAIQYLEQALQDKQVSYRHPAIKWKLALLNESTDTKKAVGLCSQIIADTLANEYHQRAENLLAALEAGIAG